MAHMMLTLDESSATRLLLFWLPVTGMEVVFPALGSTNAAADEGLIVCARVCGRPLAGRLSSQECLHQQKHMNTL